MYRSFSDDRPSRRTWACHSKIQSNLSIKTNNEKMVNWSSHTGGLDSECHLNDSLHKWMSFSEGQYNYCKKRKMPKLHLDRVKRIWCLSPMRAAKVQASLHIRTVSPEPSLLAHTSSGSRETFRQKARSLAPLNGWACAVKICHDGNLEDTNLLDGAYFIWL